MEYINIAFAKVMCACTALPIEAAWHISAIMSVFLLIEMRRLWKNGLNPWGIIEGWYGCGCFRIVVSANSSFL